MSSGAAGRQAELPAAASRYPRTRSGSISAILALPGRRRRKALVVLEEFPGMAAGKISKRDLRESLAK